MSNLKSGYYISTGAKNCFYTLRYWFEEQYQVSIGPGLPPEIKTTVRDYFRQNLSIDKAEAIVKAKELTGRDLSASFDVRPIGERHEVDWSIFQSGKYLGRSIYEVKEIDADYLVWLCENAPASYAKTVELARSLVAHELAEAKAERESKYLIRVASEYRVKKLLGPVISELKDGRGGFRDSIASDLEKGSVPTGRALDITLDILAKIAGRRGSKAYNARLDELADLFAKA